MNRILQASKRITVGWLLWPVLGSLQDLAEELFPCIAPPIHPRALVPDFARRGDHLFIHDSKSARKNVLFETISLSILFLIAVTILIWVATWHFQVPVLVALSGSISVFYLVFMFFKLFVVRAALLDPPVDYSTHMIEKLRDEELPVYTVLVPLREEAEVMDQIVASMKSIDYPAEKLDLIMTVEEYDIETRVAIERSGIPSNWRVVVLPDTQPKTKPKALNVAFLEARGEFLVIYDAEIMPDPDQLKKAYLAFRDNPSFGVFQTRLDHYNSDQSILTKLFTTEFTFHYDFFLPGLSRLGFPVPLSGHSTHFRTDALRQVGAWDPYNVAEDCEIGLRLFRQGYKIGMINSMSREEATATVHSWLMQRTRWKKGFIQSSIVHLRYPFALYRDLGGFTNFIAFLFLVPGAVLVNILNMVTLSILVAWFLSGSSVIQSLYPLPILYISSFAFLVGGFLFVFLNLVALYHRGKFHLVRYWFLMPLYWVLLSVASVRAAIQLIRKPHYWEKTVHGTHLTRI
jgi:cellulose synthase/poly-beta-1,6-N-acetylglucosamine synthase-like glycosyltransferase